MNVCLCKRPKNAPPRCRDPQVGVKDGNLRCGTTSALATVLANCALVAGAPEPTAEDAGAGAIVQAMRAAGWRVEPPRKVRT